MDKTEDRAEDYKHSWLIGLDPADMKRQHDFFKYRITHPRMQAVYTDMLPLLTPYSESNIILVVGATGVGKSAFTRDALKKMISEHAAKCEADRSIIPIIGVEAIPNTDSRQIFADLYSDMLEELGEPCVEKKGFIDIVDGIATFNGDTRMTGRKLRRLARSAMKRRKTMVCVIDEAYHLLRVSKKDDVLQVLKSDANLSGAKIVLVGSYDLFDLIGNHAQLARRSHIVHFERYNIDVEKDKEQYREVLQLLQQKWPCAYVPNFSAISEDLMEASLGCVGLLKTFLLDAAAMQLRNGGKWDKKFLGKAIKAAKLLKTVRVDIRKGEDKVRDALLGQSMWNDADITRLDAMMS